MGAKKGLLPWVVGLIVLGVLGLVMYDVRIYTDRAYVCENTGSRYGFREWPNGAQTRQWYRVSQLEEFMEKEYPGVMRHRWTSYAGTGKNLIGTPRSFGHGRPGGAYWLKEDVLRNWMARHSKAEARALYDKLCTLRYQPSEDFGRAIYEEAKAYPD